jgi:hypothetical protein
MIHCAAVRVPARDDGAVPIAALRHEEGQEEEAQPRRRGLSGKLVHGLLCHIMSSYMWLQIISYYMWWYPSEEAQPRLRGLLAGERAVQRAVRT